MDTETQINKDVLISSVRPVILWKGLIWMTLSHIQRLENRQRTSRVELNYNTHQPPRLNEENTKSCRDVMQQTWCWFSHQKWIFLRTTGDISKYFSCVKTRETFRHFRLFLCWSEPATFHRKSPSASSLVTKTGIFSQTKCFCMNLTRASAQLCDKSDIKKQPKKM